MYRLPWFACSLPRVFSINSCTLFFFIARGARRVPNMQWLLFNVAALMFYIAATRFCLSFPCEGSAQRRAIAGLIEMIFAYARGNVLLRNLQNVLPTAVR